MAIADVICTAGVTPHAPFDWDSPTSIGRGGSSYSRSFGMDSDWFDQFEPDPVASCAIGRYVQVGSESKHL